MGVIDKLLKIITIFMAGYEVNEATNEDKSENIIIKYDEVLAKRVVPDINSDKKESIVTHNMVFVIIISTLLLIIIIMKIYKKMVKNVAASLVNA